MAVGCHLYLARYKRPSERPPSLIKRENGVTDALSATQQLQFCMTSPLYTTALAMRVPRILIERYGIKIPEAAWPDVFNCYVMNIFIIKMSSVQNN